MSKIACSLVLLVLALTLAATAQAPPAALVMPPQAAAVAASAATSDLQPVDLAALFAAPEGIHLSSRGIPTANAAFIGVCSISCTPCPCMAGQGICAFKCNR